MKLLDNPARDKIDAWRFFLEHYTTKDSPALAKPAFQDIPFISRGVVFSKLLNALAIEWATVYESNQYPRPSEVVQKFEEVGIMRPEFWADTLWVITSQILQEAMGGNENNKAPERLLQELMTMWQLFFIRFNARQTDSASEGWVCIPGAGTTLNKITTGSHLTRSFEKRLSKFVPKFGEDSTVALAALVTFTLFTRQGQIINISEECRYDNFPFVNLIAHLLPRADLEPLIRQAHGAINQVMIPEEKVAKLLEHLRSAPYQAFSVIGAKNFAKVAPPGQHDREHAKQMEEFFIKRLARAIEKADIRIVEGCWADAQQVFSRPEPNAKPAIPRKFYNFLLTGLLALGHSQRAIDAWNQMISSGMKPTVDTWTAMLSGCQRSGDSVGLEQMWTRMIASGVQPDAHAWGARIHGLLSLGRRNEGLTALEDMGHAWLESTKPKQLVVTKKTKGNSAKTKLPSNEPAPAPKPDIEIINGALIALSRVRRLSLEQKRPLMEKVLRWASRFGITPDVITYNIFLRMALQEGDNGRAFKLLKHMDDKQIQPDIATFTLIIQATLKQYSFIDLPKAEQGRTVFTLLDEVESQGVKLSSRLYSAVIDGLLKQHSNISAVRGVLDHMNNRNILPTTYVYTMLATHYFTRDPPDIEAVDSLWTYVTTTPGVLIDNIFFDRVVEGYAQCGEVGKMMTALARASKAGQHPSWKALAAALQALTDVHDWDRAKQLISDVEKGEGLAKAGISAKGSYFGQSKFWALVRELGLSREDEDILEETHPITDALSTQAENTLSSLSR